ncbi:hypothetical protein An02g11780 [Aspergillus niger]|uniref:Uncharacterized protein n=2 Tax=Aspergillus niger TaxID=5061 RepID=A2QEP5_ASPNC|nr:hypothetical protein An02g11780 [Aspergillus niger]CAK37879.1 hypothetical protein An02g11780 [Aspergillus niger]
MFGKFHLLVAQDGCNTEGICHRGVCVCREGWSGDGWLTEVSVSDEHILVESSGDGALLSGSFRDWCLLAHGTSSIGFDTVARILGPSMRRPVWQGLKQFQAAINVYYNAGILQPMPVTPPYFQYWPDLNGPSDRLACP